MKKILVLSDSHGHFEKILKIYELEKPDIVIFSGDGTEDIENFLYIYENIEHYEVRGNCDFFSKFKDEDVFKIENYNFFLTHGHLYDVKFSLENLRKILRTTQVNIIVYGHTHRENIEVLAENKILFNSGAVKDNKYGIIIIDKEKKLYFINKKL
ncbi:MAG: YfcE family phosphodiesterase [Fusobacteriales bacterium]|nr:MAG: YfcE family phosphodiesterase [Fusobacteriales bacterium]